MLIRKITIFFFISLKTACLLRSQELINNNPVDIAFSNSIIARTESMTNGANGCFQQNNFDTNTDKKNQAENYLKIIFTPSFIAIEGYKEFGFSGKYSLQNLALTLEGHKIGVLSLSEINFRLVAAYPIAENISIGAGLGLVSKSITGYGSASTIPISIFAAMNISPQVRFGAVMENLNRAELKTQTEVDKIKQRIAVGTNINLGTDASISLDLIQEIDFNTTAALGLAYNLSKEIQIRSGYSTNQSISFGGGIYYNNLVFDLGALFALPIGFKYSFGAGYIF